MVGHSKPNSPINLIRYEVVLISRGLTPASYFSFDSKRREKDWEQLSLSNSNAAELIRKPARS